MFALGIIIGLLVGLLIGALFITVTVLYSVINYPEEYATYVNSAKSK